MRQAGYSPDRHNQTNEPSFSRPLDGSSYPTFHIYVSAQEEAWLLKLHLDQKKPSYQGTSAHAGEYDGQVVEAEAERIKSIFTL